MRTAFCDRVMKTFMLKLVRALLVIGASMVGGASLPTLDEAPSDKPPTSPSGVTWLVPGTLASTLDFMGTAGHGRVLQQCFCQQCYAYAPVSIAHATHTPPASLQRPDEVRVC